jgi:ATPase subunit of ABC transporter with duplicated ATPase domains
VVRAFPYEGNYSVYLEKKTKRMEQEGREDMARNRAIEREREWMGMSPKGRQTKSKARIKAYDDLLSARKSVSRPSSRS